jgi:hypothetical protein
MTSTLTLARRAATAVLSAALTVGVVALPSAAQAAPAVPAQAAAQQAANTVVDIPHFVAPTRKARGEVIARAGGSPKPTGSFKIVVKKGKKAVVRKNAAIVGGRTHTVGLPKLAKGKYKLVVRYSGDSRHAGAVLRKAFNVA